jgi:hypothetical protein
VATALVLGIALRAPSGELVHQETVDLSIPVSAGPLTYTLARFSHAFDAAGAYAVEVQGLAGPPVALVNAGRIDCRTEYAGAWIAPARTWADPARGRRAGANQADDRRHGGCPMTGMVWRWAVLAALLILGAQQGHANTFEDGIPEDWICEGPAVPVWPTAS